MGAAAAPRTSRFERLLNESPRLCRGIFTWDCRSKTASIRHSLSARLVHRIEIGWQHFLDERLWFWFATRPPRLQLGVPGIKHSPHSKRFGGIPVGVSLNSRVIQFAFVNVAFHVPRTFRHSL